MLTAPGLLRSAAAVVLAAAGTAAAVRAEVLPDSPPWIQLRTPSATVYSQADEERTRKLAASLAQFRHALPAVDPGLNLPETIPIAVFAFRDPEAMIPYEPVTLETVPGLMNGFYVGDKRSGYAGLRAFAPGNPLETVFHEIVHAAQFRRYELLPLWLQEGEADYFSTLRIDGTRVEVGLPPVARYQWFAGHAPAPLRWVFGTSPGARSQLDRDAVLGFYATSWAFVHFLRHTGPERLALLEKYQADLAAGVPEAKAHLAAFGLNFAALEEAFRAYASTRNFVSRFVELPAPPAPVSAEVSPALRPHLLANLGLLLLAGKPKSPALAEEHLRAAAALAPDDPLVLAALGTLEYHGGRCEPSAALYRRSLAKGEAPAVRWLEGASALLCLPREGVVSVSVEALEADEKRLEEVRLARDWLQRGLAVFPDDVPALGAYGLTYVMLQDDPAKGIEALERAMRLDQRRPDLVTNLFELYLKAGERDKARALVDGPLASRGSRSVALHARQRLLQFDLQRAAALAKEGRFEPAMKSLRQALAEESDPQLRSRLEGELARFEAYAGKQREINAYQAAADLTRKGETSAALRAFQALVATSKDPEVRERAQKAVDSLTGAGVRP